MTVTDSEETSSIGWPVLEKNIERLDREEILQLASDTIVLLHRRTCGERFREQDGDKMRTTYARVLVGAFQVYGTLLKDEELESLKARIDALEHAKGGSNQ